MITTLEKQKYTLQDIIGKIESLNPAIQDYKLTSNHQSTAAEEQAQNTIVKLTALGEKINAATEKEIKELTSTAFTMMNEIVEKLDLIKRSTLVPGITCKPLLVDFSEKIVEVMTKLQNNIKTDFHKLSIDSQKHKPRLIYMRKQSSDIELSQEITAHYNIDASPLSTELTKQDVKNSLACIQKLTLNGCQKSVAVASKHDDAT